jgi:membrane associated rhomboid family serine protease
LLYGLVAPLFGLGIDNAAHIGGLAGGFAVGYVAGTPGFSQTMERLWQILAGIAIALTAFSFFKMFMALVAMRAE